MDITTLKRGDKIKVNTWQGIKEARVWEVRLLPLVVFVHDEPAYEAACRGSLFPRPVGIHAESVIEKIEA